MLHRESLELKCNNHLGVDAIAECEDCASPMCGVCANFTDNGVLCEHCLEIRATSKFVDEQTRKSAPVTQKLIQEDDEEIAAAPRNGNSGVWDKLKLVGLIGCFAFIGYRLYLAFSGSTILTEAEIAAEEQSRASLELCLLNFWEIAELLQNDQTPGEALACVEAGAPNIISRVGDDIIVRHPRPELHGYSEVVVSKSNPVPRLIE